jgi:hypothetical protein
MHVIGHDADLDDARVVSFGFREEKAREKIRHRLSMRQTPEGGPGEVGIEAKRHGAEDNGRDTGIITKRAQGASFRTRVVAEPAL